MANIVLVRHCESVGNVAFQQSFFQQDDSMYTDEFMGASSAGWALSEYGRKHAAEVGAYLRRMTFDDSFVSDTRRTMETVELMGVPSARLVVTELLRERNYAGLECRPKKDWLRYATDLNEAMRSMTWKPPGGESMEDIAARSSSFLSTHVSENLSTLIVTHGDIIQIMRMILLGLSEAARWAFRDMRGNYVRTGQIFLYERQDSGGYVERTVHFDGTEWHDLSITFDKSS
jgi:broad specificity phosphatase PhoE